MNKANHEGGLVRDTAARQPPLVSLPLDRAPRCRIWHSEVYTLTRYFDPTSPGGKGDQNIGPYSWSIA